MRLLDAAARDLARYELGRNVVVEAGAGTGKTTLLTERLLFALLCGPGRRDVTRIVALTFTEKAAGEIKVRLSDRLSELLAAAEGRPIADARRAELAAEWLRQASARFGRSPCDIREGAAAAILALDRAMIGTIHHFAAHLLRLHPLEAGVDPSFEVDEGSAFDELFDAEWALWLDEELGERAPRRKAWLEVLQLAGLEDLEALARALCREGARQGSVGTTEAMRAQIKALARDFAALPRGKPVPPRGAILGNIEAAGERLQSLAEGFERPAPLPEADPPPKLGSSQWPKDWEGLPGRELYERGLKLAARLGPVSESLVQKSAALVVAFADRFRALYARRGFIGYDGLLTAARDLVRGDARVRESLKARYDALLIDEFQDTDPLQGELLLYLGEAPGACERDWRRLKLVPGKMFIVGDPKQSIYRFRGADIRAYEDFTGLLLSQGALKCDLQTNFRSRPGIVAAANALFAKAMVREEGLQPAYLPIHARPGAAPEGACVESVLFQDPRTPGKPIQAALRQRAEAAWMAGWIKTQKAHALKDIAILLRTSAPLGAILDALKAAAVPYVVETDSYFYGTQEVIDLVNLLRVLDDPEDRASLAGLLRSPLCLLGDRDLYALARRGSLSYLQDPPAGAVSKEAASRLKPFFSLLRGLRARANKEPLGDYIERVFEETFLLELASAAYHRDQTVSNLMKFARLAREAGEGRGATLKEFIARVCRSMREDAEEGESALADEQLDAVRILTVHKSKGLEFPVVLLPNLSAAAGSGAEKPSAVVDWKEGTAGLRLAKARAQDAAMALIEEAQEEREEREYVRLLYVALTRAKDKLILLGDARAGRSSSFASIMAACGSWPLPDVPALEVDASAAPPASVPGRPDRAGKADAAKLAGAWLARRKERIEAEGRPMFATATAAAREAPKRSPRREEDSGAASGGALVGQVCHRVLEDWDFRAGGKIKPAVAAACAALRPSSPAASWKGIAAEAGEILEAFLASPAARELAESEILGRELPFACPKDGAVLRGSIDLLYRRQGLLWVGDYKTDRKPEPARYAAQGRVYVEAAEQALGEKCGFKLIFLRTGETV